MKRSMGLTGERSNHKIAGIFEDAGRMDECREELVRTLGSAESIEPLEPGSDSPAWRLEPESRGIWHTLVRAHLWLTLGGAVVGALIFGLLAMLGVAFVAQNPWSAALLLIIFCAIGGALLGGFLTVRPDHTPFIARVRTALDEQRHVLVVHTTDRGQTDTARNCLERYTDDTVATL